MVMFFIPPTGSAPASNASVTFVVGSQDNTPLSTYTYAATSIGAAAASRIIVVSVTARGNSTSDPTSVTAAGNALTKISSTNGSDINTSLWRLPVNVLPTGTTADIVVTFPSARSMCHIAVFRIIGQYSDVPIWSQTVLNGGSSTVLTFSGSPALTSGATLAHASAPSFGGSYTWSGLTESYDRDTEGTDCRVSGAISNSIPASFTATTSSGVTGLQGIAAAWY